MSVVSACVIGVPFFSSGSQRSRLWLWLQYICLVCVFVVGALQIEPWKRPRSSELVHSLEAMKYSALMKVILMDLSRLDSSSSSATPAATNDTSMDREALENILGMFPRIAFEVVAIIICLLS